MVAVTDSAKQAIDLSLGLAAVMIFWLGLMRIAQDSGLVTTIARTLAPVMRRLFPDIPDDHPAMGQMMMNMTANFLGLGNAATPFGLKAMHTLQSLNPKSDTASNAMCMFLAINTSSVQLIPVSAIAYLVAAGSQDPTAIVLSSILATSVSTTVGVTSAWIMQSRHRGRAQSWIGEKS